MYCEYLTCDLDDKAVRQALQANVAQGLQFPDFTNIIGRYFVGLLRQRLSPSKASIYTG
jgi:hypothetical protein